MKRIHLLRHDGPPAALGPLFEAARREGLRVGWLDLGAAEAPEAGGASGGAPPELETALAEGAFRAGAVAPGRVMAAKALTGPPVLRNLLREHFLGCALVVVRAAEGAAAAPELAEVPALEPEAEGFRVTPLDGAAQVLSADALAARLRRPRPFG